MLWSYLRGVTLEDQHDCTVDLSKIFVFGMQQTVITMET